MLANALECLEWVTISAACLKSTFNFHSHWTLQALKVLNNVLDHGRRVVPARTILFNIRQINQRVGLRKRYGIEGVDSSGLVHRFLEGEDPLHFSTKLFDTRCSPVYFANVLNFPQTARVYLHPSTDGEEEETKLLPNLSTTTITEVTHDHHLVVRKLSDDGNQLGPTFTVPLNACLKVVLGYPVAQLERVYIVHISLTAGGCNKTKGLCSA